MWRPFLLSYSSLASLSILEGFWRPSKVNLNQVTFVKHKTVIPSGKYSRIMRHDCFLQKLHCLFPNTSYLSVPSFSLYRHQTHQSGVFHILSKGLLKTGSAFATFPDAEAFPGDSLEYTSSGSPLPKQEFSCSYLYFTLISTFSQHLLWSPKECLESTLATISH